LDWVGEGWRGLARVGEGGGVGGGRWARAGIYRRAHGSPIAA
jgi:hypothetical protein